MNIILAAVSGLTSFELYQGNQDTVFHTIIPKNITNNVKIKYCTSSSPQTLYS